MNPIELLRTIYLGDRACKGITIDGWNARVSIHVDVVSRIRSKNGRWDHYTDEDIVDGRLVFTRVRALRMDPSGPIPNDFINDVRVVGAPEGPAGGEYTFVLSVGSVDDAAVTTEVVMEVRAEGLHLEDPRRPGVAITT